MDRDFDLTLYIYELKQDRKHIVAPICRFFDLFQWKYWNRRTFEVIYAFFLVVCLGFF